MSATIKVIYREEDLSPSDCCDMFIAIDDVIHLHYRDLQIDFSKKEFEDFARTFKLQADSLLENIDKTDCKDMPSDDLNVNEYKIWLASKLVHGVTCHPQRISLEECRDGYHLSYRNYNLLLDEKGFRSLKKAFAIVESDVPLASNIDELIELFKLNRIKFELLNEDKPDDGGRVVYKIIIPERHASKAGAVMTGIGMEGRVKSGSAIYSKKGLVIELITEEEKDEID
jgi:hypothetical protein